MESIEQFELFQTFSKAGFYYRVCQKEGKILVGPNTHNNVLDMEFEDQYQARAFLKGWESCRRQFEV